MSIAKVNPHQSLPVPPPVGISRRSRILNDYVVEIQKQLDEFTQGSCIHLPRSLLKDNMALVELIFHDPKDPIASDRRGDEDILKIFENSVSAPFFAKRIAWLPDRIFVVGELLSDQHLDAWSNVQAIRDADQIINSVLLCSSKSC